MYQLRCCALGFSDELRNRMDSGAEIGQQQGDIRLIGLSMSVRETMAGAVFPRPERLAPAAAIMVRASVARSDVTSLKASMVQSSHEWNDDTSRIRSTQYCGVRTKAGSAFRCCSRR